jgi:hypothetical protein
MRGKSRNTCYPKTLILYKLKAGCDKPPGPHLQGGHTEWKGLSSSSLRLTLSEREKAPMGRVKKHLAHLLTPVYLSQAMRRVVYFLKTDFLLCLQTPQGLEIR